MDLNLILNRNKNKRATDKDMFVGLEFKNNSKPIPTSDISKIINTNEIFEKERNECTKYRLNVTINPIMTNILPNPITQVYDGDTLLTGDDRLNAIQIINDNLYTYKLGYDIFDNHYMRVETFKTGETIYNFTGKTMTNLIPISTAIDKNIMVDNGWLCFQNKTKINDNRMFKTFQPCEKIDLFPTREYFSFKPIFTDEGIKNNWDYFITYPFDSFTGTTLVTSPNWVNGIPLFSARQVSFDDNIYLQVTTAVKHGLKKDDIIKIKLNNNDNKTYLIYDIGDINKENKEQVFLIDTNRYTDLKNPYLSYEPYVKRIVKVINNVDSNYYIRKFRKLPNFKNETVEINSNNIDSKILNNNTLFSSEQYQLGFAQNIFADKLTQIQYIDDIDINLLKDNLGRPLSEIFFTVIKRNELNGVNEPEGLFTKIYSGFDKIPNSGDVANLRKLCELNFLTNSPTEYDITISGTTIFQSYSIDTTESNIFLGDIVEYNKTTLKETVIDDVYHRFNTVQRELDNTFIYHKGKNDGTYELISGEPFKSKEGYFYKPHYKIPLKNYSNVVSQNEMPEVLNCENFVSGVTNDNVIVELSTQQSENVKYLILKMQNIENYVDYDTIRILRKTDKKHINTTIRLRGDLTSHLLIPYNETFFGDVTLVDINNYTIRKFNDPTIPLHAQDTGDGRIIWRDIMPEGYFDDNSQFKNELIFTNGSLYLNKTINFYLRRQDPFGEFNMRRSTFPKEFSGEKYISDIINNKIENQETVC